MTNRRAAFSLVELSIVLVILGLLVGGILAGQSLIRAGEIRKMMTSGEKYKTATLAFRDKYFALPGDFSNATAFWGTNTAGCPNGGAATGTCNGDGNGQIYYTTERYRYWQHLVMAGLLDGSYSGIAGNTTNDVPGENIPWAGYRKVAIAVGYASDTGGTTSLAVGTRIMLANCCHGSSGRIDSPGMEPEVAWQMDKKIDDGVPGSGFFQHMTGYPGCANSNAYSLGTTDTTCSMRWYMGID